MFKNVLRSKGRAIARLSVLALVGGSAVVASAPAAHAAYPLICDGSTVYGVAQIAGQPPIRSFDVTGTGSIPVDTVTGPSIPTDNLLINQAGITAGGEKLISVRAGTIYTYDFATETTVTAPAQGAAGFNGVGGAVDSTTNLMYLGGFGKVNGSVRVGVTAFDPATNGPAGGTAGLVAQIELPTSVMPNNGDFAFDVSGNMYIVAGTNVTGGVSGAIYRVDAPLPTAPSSTVLTATKLATIPVTKYVSYAGIAFGPEGTIVVGGGGREFIFVDPNTGQFGAPRALSLNQNYTDLASCVEYYG